MDEKPKVLMDSGNLLGLFFILTWFLPIEAIVLVALICKYDGIQYVPIYGISEIQLKLGIITPWAKNRIFAAEQSFRSEVLHWNNLRTMRPWRVFGDFIDSEQKLLAIASFALLPHRRTSIKYLALIQKLVGEIPIVHYPPHKGEMASDFDEFRYLLFQPEAGLTERLQITEPRNIKYKNGYICFDTDKARSLPWSIQEQIEAYGDHIGLVHIRFTSGLEAKKSFTGGIDSQLVEMILELKKNNYEGDWVIEMPMDGLSVILGKQWPLAIISPWHYIKAHRELCKTLRAIIENA